MRIPRHELAIDNRVTLAASPAALRRPTSPATLAQPPTLN